MTRPLLLDLFCGAGGAAMGYHRAGFDVVGVDIKPQPNYPFEFIQADAIEMLSYLTRRNPPNWRGVPIAAVHASPPCQDHSPLKALSAEHGTGWMLPHTRKALSAVDLPWVIENVAGAAMVDPITLCGGMFGLRTYRHRKFESNMPIAAPPHPKHVIRTATKQRRQKWDEGWHVSITGDVGTYVGPEGMGIDWMTGNELSQAIPPAYTEHIGKQLIAALSRVA